MKIKDTIINWLKKIGLFKTNIKDFKDVVNKISSWINNHDDIYLLSSGKITGYSKYEHTFRIAMPTKYREELKRMGNWLKNLYESKIKITFTQELYESEAPICFIHIELIK